MYVVWTDGKPVTVIRPNKSEVGSKPAGLKPNFQFQYKVPISKYSTLAHVAQKKSARGKNGLERSCKTAIISERGTMSVGRGVGARTGADEISWAPVLRTSAEVSSRAHALRTDEEEGSRAPALRLGAEGSSRAPALKTSAEDSSRAPECKTGEEDSSWAPARRLSSEVSSCSSPRSTVEVEGAKQLEGCTQTPGANSHGPIQIRIHNHVLNVQQTHVPNIIRPEVPSVPKVPLTDPKNQVPHSSSTSEEPNICNGR